jgi:nitrogen fixation NifU-like protein
MNDRLRALYKSHILTRSKDERHFGELPNYTHLIEAYNPMCGDKYNLYLQIEGNVVINASFKGFGCAISKASTAMLTERLIGAQLTDINEMVTLFLEILNPDSEEEVTSLTTDEELQAFAGTRDYPERLQCASLVWDELEQFKP